MNTLPIYILAGGKSSRFGSDKARAEIDGVPLVQRTAESLADVATYLTVVADRPAKYADLGLRTIVDLEPELGPMGGLATALKDLQSEDRWLLLASCDLLDARPDWVRTLMTAARPPFAAFRGERWEPLFALYHASLLPAVESRLRSGNRAMFRLLEETGGVAVPIPPDWPRIAQANTPDELEQYLRERNHL